MFINKVNKLYETTQEVDEEMDAKHNNLGFLLKMYEEHKERVCGGVS